MKNLLIIAMVLVFSGQLSAKESNNITDVAKETDIYTELSREVSAKHRNDTKVVRYYFSFNCPYCKQVKNFINVWGKSLPGDFKYIPTPVVDETDASRMLAVAYHYVTENALNYYYVERFVDTIFKHIHKISTTDQLGRLIKEAMVHANVKTKPFLSKIRDPKFLSVINTIKKQQDDYEISLTPSVVIGAKYVTHLGLAKGDPSRFIEILNAVVNLHMYSTGGIR